MVAKEFDVEGEHIRHGVITGRVLAVLLVSLTLAVVAMIAVLSSTS